MYEYIFRKSCLKYFSAFLAVLTIFIGTVLMISISAVPVCAENSESGLVLKKTAQYDSASGTADITLEVYTTGQKVIKEVTSVIPTDIVLVLDVSASMSAHFSCKYAQANISNSTLMSSQKDYYIMDNGNYYLITGKSKTSGIAGSSTKYTYSYTDSNGETKSKTSTGLYTKPSFVYVLKEDTESPTKLEALKDSAINFIDSVIEKSENTDNRVAVVTFSTNADYATGTGASTALKDMSSPSDADEVKTAVRGLSAYGATDPQKGLEYAKYIFDANPVADGENRNRTVIFFTDGTPGTKNDKWDSTSTQRAESAVEVSNTLKNYYGADVYAVGIFFGADENSAGTAYTNTSVSSEISAHGNYFMQYVSSNNGTPQTDGYYFSADNSGSLSNIFTAIANRIEEGGSSTELKEDAVIRDIVSPYFTLPENTDEVTVQTVDYIGENQWGNPADVSDLSVHINGTRLDVTGFNFSENWAGKETTITDNGITTEIYRGKKLIITFKIKIIPNYLGGTQTETNSSDSGVYSDGEVIDRFDVPVVDVPLKTVQPIKMNGYDEWNVYMTSENETAESFRNLQFKAGGNILNFAEIFDGTNNAQVIVSLILTDSRNNAVKVFTIPSGMRAENWNIDDIPVLSDSSYTIKCTVTDANENNNSTTAQTGIQINVFKPVLTFSDMTVYYGDKQVDLSQVQPKAVEWKCGQISDLSVTMNTNKPVLTFAYSGVTGTAVNQTEDYTVKAEKVGVQDNNINLLDIENAVKFKRECSTENLTGVNSDKDEIFKIHIKTVSLVIKKSVIGEFSDKLKEFGFSVKIKPLPDTGLSETTYNFSLADGQSERLNGLPKGAEFEIAEIDVPEMYEVYFQVNGEDKGIKNDRKITGTLYSDMTEAEVANKLETVPVTGVDSGTAFSGLGFILFSLGGLLALKIYAKLRNI